MMVEIVKIGASSIELKGVAFKESDKVQQILDICHRFKHLYMEGFPCGRKTRRENNLKLKKWAACPKITFTYIVTPPYSENMTINILVSDLQDLRKRYTQTQIEYFTAMFVQGIADEIIRTVT